MNYQEEDYFERTSDLIRNYTDDRVLLIKIRAAKKTGKMFSKLIFIVVAVLLLSMFLLFVSIMGGYYFAELTGSLYKGFSIVAGIYLFLFILFLLLFRTYISEKIMDMTAKVFFEKDLSVNEE
jgi:hypothetical protein